MITQETLLVQLLVHLVDQVPAPLPSTRPRRGRPSIYSDKLFLKALVIMIVKRLHRVGQLLAVLEESTAKIRISSCASCSPREGASPPGVPSSEGCAPYPRLCLSGSVVWDDTWWYC